MLFLSLFLKRFVTLLVGPVSQEAVTEAVGDKENRLCVLFHNAACINRFPKLEPIPISMYTADRLSLFLFIFGETQCWQPGKWEKTNKTKFVVKHQIWEEN